MGLAAQRLLYIPVSAVLAVSMTALSAPYALALSTPAAPPPPYVVTIDPGHGGSPDDAHPEKLFDPGGKALNGLLEKDLTLDIARRVRDRLKKQGVHVVMTRDSDQYVDITPRIRTANANSSNLFVSIHLNYFAQDLTVGGSLVLYPNAASESFARTMSATLGKRLAPIGIPADGTQLKDNLWTTAQMPAVTVECAYLTNPGEASLLKKTSTRDAIAGAIVSGLAAQDPELTKRAAETVAFAKAHLVQPIAAAPSRAQHGSLLLPWLPLALLALAVVFRRRLVPALAMIIAIVGVATGRFNPDEPEWRKRSGVRRRRSRARLWGTS
jgi:N-acetylmuramoyl-L-alanine amidase